MYRKHMDDLASSKDWIRYGFSNHLQSQIYCTSIKPFTEEEDFRNTINQALAVEFGDCELLNAIMIKPAVTTHAQGDHFSGMMNRATVSKATMVKIARLVSQPPSLQHEIKMEEIRLYSDGVFPRGLAVTYRIDG